MNAPGPGPFFPPDDAVESAAAEWLVRQDHGFTPAQQDEFLSWLAASPAHRESFERHRRLWRDCDALAQWRPGHSAEPNPDLLARLPRPRRWRWVAPVGLAAAAAVAVFLWRTPAPETPAGEQVLAFEAADYRQETLPDGSVLDLNRGAHAVVQFSPHERRVLLVQGEAQFTVAKNPARPFVVRAGGVDVRAIGTAFNVKLAGPSLEVLVTEGTVHVERRAAAPAADSAASAVMPAPAVLAALTAGHRTVIAVASESGAPEVTAAVRTVSAEEIAQVLDWKPRLLDFEAVPLADVVATFNRLNRTQLAVGDPSLAGLPIVASIRSDNVEGFARLLEATMGMRAERTAAGVIVLHRAR